MHVRVIGWLLADVGILGDVAKFAHPGKLREDCSLGWVELGANGFLDGDVGAIAAGAETLVDQDG